MINHAIIHKAVWQSSLTRQAQDFHDPIKDMVHAAIPASCTILVFDNGQKWTGSGFHIGNGYIVTAAHVAPLTPSGDTSITFDGMHLYPVKVMHVDHNIDAALLYCATIPAHAGTVHLGDSNEVEIGDIVAVVGSPEGWHDTATFGRVTNIHQNMGNMAPTNAWHDMIFIDADILEGASGGMTINVDGEVIGSIMGVAGKHAELGIGQHAISPSNKIKEMIAKLDL